VAAAAVGKHRKLGLLGTRYLVEGPVYREKLAARGLEYELPEPEARQRINDIIFDELVYGQLRACSATLLSERDRVARGTRLRRRGARLHRDPVAHLAPGLRAAGARLHAHPGPRGVAGRRA
jgi:aspartate/glutamate racemase